MKQLRVFRKLEDWQSFRRELALVEPQMTIGFVPTMGALHDGHRSLLERARKECDYLVLSIFVNPTQFNNQSDLEKYPITLDQDLSMAEIAGVDFAILPSRDEVYSDHYRYRLSESNFSKTLCGAHRPGHFDGVLTVVLKLFNLISPHFAYFGQKDFQQLELIRGMVESLFLNIEIVGCPTVRESDGLAMSSRNLRLNPEQRKTAPLIASLLRESLINDKPTEWISDRLKQNGFLVDYVEDATVDRPPIKRRFVAAHLGEIRLIDNMSLAEAKSLNHQKEERP